MSSSEARPYHNPEYEAVSTLPGQTRRRMSSLERHQAHHRHDRSRTVQHATPIRAKRAGFLPALPRAMRALLPWAKRGWYVLAVLIAAALALLLARFAQRTPAALPGAIDPVMQPYFDARWERTDLPVQIGEVQRGWTWGPVALFSGSEPYAQSGDGERHVQYYDKGRLEINDAADPGAVTSGLLVRELVSGQVALGDDPTQAETRAPAEAPVAGDPPAINPAAPTYASFRAVASLAADRLATEALGRRVTQTIDRQGNLGELPAGADFLSDAVEIAAFEPTLKHNIPRVFWRFLHRKGAVYEHGQVRPYEPVFSPWEAVMGLPITEPYWVTTNVAGTPRWVLVQLFERRALTYTPTNPPHHQVDLANAGRHYFEWRYGRALTPAETLLVEPAPVELTRVSATIAWRATTPLRTQIYYGASSAALTGRAGSQDAVLTGTLALTGTLTLADLTPGTRYLWRVVGQDAAGQTVRSPLHGFRTSPDPRSKPVCLTFDDGPAPGTETVLDVLDGRVPATFFLTGANMDGQPERQGALVERMLREGHQLANHTFSHLPMTTAGYLSAYGDLSDPAALERFRENYAHNERHFQALLGTDEPIFWLARLPGDGGYIESGGTRVYVDATEQLGMAYAGWTFELAPNGHFGQLPAANWQGIDGVAAITSGLPQAHDILLLHDTHLRGRGGLLAAIIRTLADNGYTFGRLDATGACMAP